MDIFCITWHLTKLPINDIMQLVVWSEFLTPVCRKQIQQEESIATVESSRTVVSRFHRVLILKPAHWKPPGRGVDLRTRRRKRRGFSAISPERCGQRLNQSFVEKVLNSRITTLHCASDSVLTTSPEPTGTYFLLAPVERTAAIVWCCGTIPLIPEVWRFGFPRSVWIRIRIMLGWKRLAAAYYCCCQFFFDPAPHRSGAGPGFPKVSKTINSIHRKWYPLSVTQSGAAQRRSGRDI